MTSSREHTGSPSGDLTPIYDEQELLDDDLLNEMAFQDLKDACVSTDSTRRYADRPTG